MNNKPRNQHWLWCLLLAQALGTTGFAQRELRTWVSLDGVSRAGTAPTIEVTGAKSNLTTLKISVPGMWQTVTKYGQGSFTQLEVPAPRLTGKGFAQKLGERSWFDFPAQTKLGLRPLSLFQEAPSAISVFQPRITESVARILETNKLPTTEIQLRELKLDPAGARPGIPTLRGLLAVSRKTSASDLKLNTLSQGAKLLKLNYPLLPAGYEETDTLIRLGIKVPSLIDETFYAKLTTPYRGVQSDFSTVSGIGAFATSELRLPVVEVVDTNSISIITNLVVEISHLQGTEDFACPIPWDVWDSLPPFVNGAALRDSITAKGIAIESSRSAHYLILTPQSLRSELTTFALWKQSKGLNVDIATVGNTASDDVAANWSLIDAYIEKYFHEHYCNGVYVLLVGDVNLIPSGRSTRVTADPYGSNSDSDHVYEVLGNDLFASLYVGRLAVANATQLRAQLNKILSYEKDPTGGSWPLRATLAANSQNDDGSFGVSSSWPSKYAAAVNAIANYGGYSSPPTFSVRHAGASSSSGIRAVNADIVSDILAGRGHVLYRGHGDQDSWTYGWDGSNSSTGSPFSEATQIPKCTNSAYPIVYAIACQNSVLQNGTSIAKAWMNQTNGGAVAHFGASANSNTAENHERAKGIFRAIYESGYTRLGPALAAAEAYSYLAVGGGGGWENNTFCYLLLGDPEMTIRRQAVAFKLSAIPNLSDLLTGTLITIQNQEGQIVSNSFVNVHLLDGTRVNGMTGPDGNLLVPKVSTSQILHVDVNADGYAANDQAFVWIDNTSFDRTGAFTLRIVGEAGEYLVQASEDLAAWKTLATVSLKSNTYQYTDQSTLRVRSKYYRAVKIR